MKRGVETSVYFNKAVLELTDERARDMGQNRSEVVEDALMPMIGRAKVRQRWAEIVQRENNGNGKKGGAHE